MNQVQIEVVSVPKDISNKPEQGPRPPRMISPEFFSYTLSQVSGLTHNVILYGSGDPLLHPQFDDLMDACYMKDMKVHLVTDGLHMGEHRYLLNYPQLYELTFDLTDIDQERIDYKHHMDAILGICETAATLDYPLCTILFSGSNVNRKPATRFLMTELGKHYHPEFVSEHEGFRICRHVFVRLLDDEEKTKPVTHGTCRHCAKTITILANGIVTPCRQDREGVISLGNIHMSSLNRILDSGRLKKMLVDFSTNEIREPFCQNCRYRGK